MLITGTAEQHSSSTASPTGQETWAVKRHDRCVCFCPTSQTRMYTITTEKIWKWDQNTNKREVSIKAVSVAESNSEVSLKISSNQMLTAMRNSSHEGGRRRLCTPAVHLMTQHINVLNGGSPAVTFETNVPLVLIMLFSPVAKAVGGILEDVVGNHSLD